MTRHVSFYKVLNWVSKAWTANGRIRVSLARLVEKKSQENVKKSWVSQLSYRLASTHVQKDTKLETSCSFNVYHYNVWKIIRLLIISQQCYYFLFVFQNAKKTARSPFKMPSGKWQTHSLHSSIELSKPLIIHEQAQRKLLFNQELQEELQYVPNT